jgi:hypothetical protein
MAGGADAQDETWSMTAVRVEAPPVIDGVIEDLWYRAEPARLARQFRPARGAPAKADTEVYVLYDDRAIYFGWVCHEPDVSGLVACATVRDMFLNDDDSIDVMLDANNDYQSAYDFMVNWKGIKYDGSFARDSEVGGGAWDGHWDAATSVGEDAWYCEIAVPWETMRYDRGASSLGVQFLRFRKPEFEETFWASDGSLLNRVSSFGRLEGFEDLPRPKPFGLTPYVTARGEEAYDYYGTGEEGDWEFKPRYGGDFSFRAGSAVTALATVLPDYAYIEADPAEINLKPSELYLDEKRPFFTDGFEFFDNDFLYTRRFTEIAGGAKVTGRAGDFNYGALDVIMLDDDPRFPEDNFALGRVSYDFPGGSTVGVTGMGRRGVGAEVPPTEPHYGGDSARYNNVAVFDGRIVFPKQLSLDWGGYKSYTAGEGGDGYDYFVSFGRSGVAQYISTWYYEMSEDFQADMSFAQPENLGTRGVGLYGQNEFQLNRAGLRSFVPFLYYEHHWTMEGESEYDYIQPTLRLTSETGYFVRTEYRGGRDSRYVPFGYPDFRSDVVEFAAGHTPASWGRLTLSYWRGMWYGEYYHYYGTEFDAIPFPALVFTGDFEVGNPRSGDRFFVGNLKTTHNLTDELFWRVIVQGDTDSRLSSASVLWGWDFRPGSTAYLAYEQQRDSNLNFVIAEQVAFLKISYMLSF